MSDKLIVCGSASERYMTEKIAELERENAALREEIKEVKKGFAPTFVAELHAECVKLERENAALKIERNRLRVVLQDIADASGFDNIGNWARNKAKDALRKKAEPIHADHSGDINKMMQKPKETQP